MTKGAEAFRARTPSWFSPFFSMEFKAEEKRNSRFIGINQAAEHLTEIAVPLLFLLVMDHELATIHVHHAPESEAGAVQCNAGVFKFYLLQNVAAGQALHRAVANVLGEGKEKYKPAICAVLDTYGKKLTGQGALISVTRYKKRQGLKVFTILFSYVCVCRYTRTYRYWLNIF